MRMLSQELWAAGSTQNVALLVRMTREFNAIRHVVACMCELYPTQAPYIGDAFRETTGLLKQVNYTKHTLE